jgi:hypothetical protein
MAAVMFILTFISGRHIYTTKIKLKSFCGKNENIKMSASHALFKKELITLFRSNDILTGYLSVIFSLPFLDYICCKLIKTVIVNTIGNILIFPLILFMNMLFVSVCSLFAADILKSDTKNINIVNSIPIQLKKQLMCKCLIVLALSLFSALLSALILYFTNILPWQESVYLFFICCALTTSAVFTLSEKLNKNAANSDSVQNIGGTLLSILILLLSAAMEFTLGYIIMPALLLIISLYALLCFYKFNLSTKKRSEML